MNRNTLVFLMLLVSMGVQAQDTQLATPAKTATVEDSVSDELASIVALCATRHESDQLHSQWAKYLRKNYHGDMDIDALVREITRQATGYWQVRLISASMLGSKSRSGAPTSQAEIRAKQKLQDFILATPGIEKALRNTGRATVANMTQ
ncbi:MAG: hypothetical protein E2O64_03060 [Gammaproteobacteria bacterium]|nr:MAG: hypothetical protein E2O64_03060 [Gammaproteobacteria bacterium]